MMITKEQKKIQKYFKASLSEARNSKTDEQSEKSQHHAQRVCWNTDFNWSDEITLSSNRWPFHSFRTIHIKQPNTISILQSHASQTSSSNKIIKSQQSPT